LIGIKNGIIIAKKKEKLTKEQIREKDRLRKQEKRESLRKKLGDDEYKKQHAKQIKEQRQKKKNNN
jgi:hypothetical protein